MKFWDYFKSKPTKVTNTNKDLKFILTCDNDYVFINISWPLIDENDGDKVFEVAFDAYKIIAMSINHTFYDAVKMGVEAFGKKYNSPKVAIAIIIAMNNHLAQESVAGIQPVVKPSQAFLVRQQ